MFEVKDVNGTNVVYLKGEVNAQTGLELKNSVIEMFKKTGTVVLSFKGVMYMNSSGLREIIDLLKRSKKDSKNLRLCDMSADIKEMFAFTGLDKVFKIYPDESQALKG
ncbi:MAG: STAS domain-containing protein [Calditerrivibrio sp.]|nr:STAS domain-containing protein [Calditerrivibrio sp.]MCA1932492.1 STAS domain-containing protein [Calditerrivibrio sp.]MCA1980830.1 STAS domain-containing protein [Calditerrivibrio sp.]